MSAPKCIAFYGILFALKPEEIGGLEDRSDPRLASARKQGLSHYWGNFDPVGERWLLFIGTNLGTLGIEDKLSVEIEEEQLSRLFAETKTKLKQGNFESVPKLHFQWQE